MSFYRFVGRSTHAVLARAFVPGALALASALATAQPTPPPDAGQILRETREPLRLPPRIAPDVVPKPPPAPALKPQPKLSVTVASFTFSGNTLYSDAELQEVIKEFVGKSLNFEELNDVVTKVRAFHRERGYFLAQAYLPEQAIRRGVVHIAVIEGRIGVLELNRRAASTLSDRLLAGIIRSHIAEGDLITETGLERPLLLINDLPTAVVASEIRRSNTIGAADLRVNVDKSGELVSGDVEFDNHGSRFTGEYRYGLNASVNNPLLWGDQLSFRGFRTQDRMWYARLSYLIPVWYYGTRIGASYSKFDYELTTSEFKALGANGEGEVSSIYGFHPIVRTRNTNVIFQFSYEDKHLIDRIAATSTLTDRSIGIAKGGLVGDFRDGVFGGGLNAYTAAVSFGHHSIATPSDAAIDDDPAAGGHRTQGDFTKFNLEARRLQRVSDTTSLLVALTAQRVSKNMASAEKFSTGGPNAVRAYPVAEGAGDEATVFQTELRYVWPGIRPMGGDFTLSGFFDYGDSKLSKDPLPTDTPNHRTIAGFGFGASIGKDGDFLMQANVAWKAHGGEPKADTQDPSPRVWVKVIKYF
jgi:hemolysin activation/secretion protein